MELQLVFQLGEEARPRLRTAGGLGEPLEEPLGLLVILSNELKEIHRAPPAQLAIERGSAPRWRLPPWINSHSGHGLPARAAPPRHGLPASRLVA
jgi:hypothetical protein